MADTSSAYIISAIVAVVVLGLSALISLMIPYRPDKSDIGSRKVWFWVLAFLTPVLAFVLCYVLNYMDLRVPAQKAAYMTAMGIGAAVSFVVYLLLGWVLSAVNKNGKLGNWF